MSELQEVKKPNGAPPIVTEDPKPLNLVQKLCAVMAAVGYLQKKGSNEKQEYKYIREADVVAKMRDEFAKRNVFIFPSLVSCERTKLSKVEYDKVKETYVTDIVVRWTFVDGDSGEERVCDIPGCSASPGDKGVYVAMTGSEKYLLMKSFLLPTGDDPEDDKNEENGSREKQVEVGEAKKRELEAKVRAQQQAKMPDLVIPLQDSVTAAQKAKINGTPEHVQKAVEEAKNDGLFEEMNGQIQTVKKGTTKRKTACRYISMTVIQGGNLIDIEIGAFDNFPMSDCKAFDALDHRDTVGSVGRFLIERNGKYYNLKDIKAIGDRNWDDRLGAVANLEEPEEPADLWTR